MRLRELASIGFKPVVVGDTVFLMLLVLVLLRVTT